MGTMQSHAIVVSSESLEHLRKDHNRAQMIMGPLVSPIIFGVVNDVASFFIAPDGSKEGWPESDLYNSRRAELMPILESDWAEVGFGDLPSTLRSKEEYPKYAEPEVLRAKAKLDDYRMSHPIAGRIWGADITKLNRQDLLTLCCFLMEKLHGNYDQTQRPEQT